MQFTAQRRITPGVADPDPDVTPQTVTEDQMLGLVGQLAKFDESGKRLALALEAPSAETVTLSLYHRDEGQALGIALGVLPTSPGTRFYRFAAAVVLTGNVLTTLDCQIGGPIYARVTADTLAGVRMLKAACVP